MSEAQAFLQRVLKRLPSSPPTAFTFTHWAHGGRPTDEGFGIMPIAGLDPEKVMAAVLDVDHYVGNVEHVVTSRSIPDSKITDGTRFYQKIDLPLLGALHHELVLRRLGEHAGYLCAGWDILTAETSALSTRDGFRSDYSHGLWLAAPGVLGYALGSAPRRDDVGFIKFKALTSGADVAASKVIKANIEGMARWAARRLPRPTAQTPTARRSPASPRPAPSRRTARCLKTGPAFSRDKTPSSSRSPTGPAGPAGAPRRPTPLCSPRARSSTTGRPTSGRSTRGAPCSRASTRRS